PDATVLGRSSVPLACLLRGQQRDILVYRCARAAERDGYEPEHPYSWSRPARCASAGGSHRFDSQPPDDLTTYDRPRSRRDLCAGALWLGFHFWRIDLFALDAARSSRRRTGASYQPDERCRSSV